MPLPFANSSGVLLVEAMRNRALAWLLVLLLVNTAYVAAFAHPTIFYMSQVVLHLVLGVVFAVLALWLYRREAGLLRTNLLRLSLLTGLALVVLGNTFPNRWVLWSHVAISILFLAALAPWLWRISSLPRFRQAFAAALGLLVLLPVGATMYRKVFPNPNDRIVNPAGCPGVDGGGRRRAEVAVLAVLSRRPTSAASSPRTSSWIRSSAASATRTSTSSGRARCTTSPRSTTSSTASPSSTCRTWSGTQAEQVVRGLPRSRGVLQRPVRQADQGADRHAGSAGRPRLHVVPLHHARGRHDGQRRLHHRVSAAARAGVAARTRTSARWTAS